MQLTRPKFYVWPNGLYRLKLEVGSSREKFDVWPGGLITDTHLKIRLKSPVIDAFYFL